MISSIDKVLDEGNCVRVTEGGEEACERVDKPTIVFVVGRIHVKAARLRTGRHKGDRSVFEVSRSFSSDARDMTSNCGTPLAPFTVLLHCPQTTENTRVRYRFPGTKHYAPTACLWTACVKLHLSPYCSVMDRTRRRDRIRLSPTVLFGNHLSPL